MTFNWKPILLLVALMVLGALALWFHSKYVEAKERAEVAERNAITAETITGNIIRTVNIINTISKANQDAKQQIALESQSTQADIKVAVANDDCARRPVPSGASERLRRYADSLRSGASGAVTSQPDI